MLEEHVIDTVRLKPEQLQTKLGVAQLPSRSCYRLGYTYKPFLCLFHERLRAVSVGYPSVWVVKPNALDSDYFASSLKNLLAAA